MIVLLCATLIVNFFGFIIPNTASGFITHSLIYIDGNADFTPANGVTGGSGTQSDPYIIEGWDISASSTRGIHICNTDMYFIIRNCYSHDGWIGIHFYNVQNGRIENTILTNNKHGIYLGGSNHNTITNNLVSSNWMAEGITLAVSNYNIIANNKVLNHYRGVYIAYSSNNIITNNNVSLNWDMAIYLRYSNSNIIANNIASSDNRYGILVLGSNDNTIINNTAFDNGAGVYIMWSHSNIIANNTAFDNGAGIFLCFGSCNNIISNNTASNNRYGIDLLSSSYTTLVNNTLENNGIFIGDNFNTHNIDTTNTANGKPIHYYKNQNNINIDGWSVGQIILFNCTNFTVKNVDCSNASMGVELVYCNYCSIEDSLFNNGSYGIHVISSKYNKISNNSVNLNSDCGIWMGYSKYNDVSNNNVNSNERYGIYLRGSNYNVISNNKVSNHNHYYGVSINLEISSRNNIHNNSASNSNFGIQLYYHSSHNNISNNIINSNKWYGIWLHLSSDSNNIFNNIISNNKYGIDLRSSSYNNIFNNNFLNNYYGFYFRRAYNNWVYHNNFIDNVCQAYDPNVNQWNDGYPSGGNYWSDYTGVDEKSGPNQDQPGSDGVGDTLYNISGGTNIDQYPLMYPWGKPRISVEKEFIPSEITTISQGAITTINITNTGDVNITSMTVIDEYVENMASNDPPEVLVTITSDEGDIYAIMSEDLTVTSTDNNITISFELPLEVVSIFWENNMLQFGEELYYLESIPKDWVVGIQYLLYPITELEIGIYPADAAVTAYSEKGASTTETAIGTLTVSEPIELEWNLP